MTNRIKNWTAARPAEEYMAETREALRAAGGRKIVFVRRHKTGPVVALTFEVVSSAEAMIYRFRIEPDVEAATQRVMESAGYTRLTPIMENQVYRTTWANVCDYCHSALALVALGGHRLEQVFFPFLLAEQEDKTYFEVFEKQRALPMAGASNASPVIVIEEVEVL